MKIYQTIISILICIATQFISVAIAQLAEVKRPVVQVFKPISVGSQISNNRNIHTSTNSQTRISGNQQKNQIHILKSLLNDSSHPGNIPAKSTQRFWDALVYLGDQLNGKTGMSVADAYYAIESAFGNTYLSKAEYDKVMENSKQFLEKWMIQNGLDINDNLAKHYAIQMFMQDTLEITVNSTDGNTITRFITTTRQVTLLKLCLLKGLTC